MHDDAIGAVARTEKYRVDTPVIKLQCNGLPSSAKWDISTKHLLPKEFYRKYWQINNKY
jgi:hypothetical protein